MTPRNDEQKQRTHERILDSAARLLRERGIAAASVADIMQGAGLTVGGFYAHFASKDDLVGATLRRTMRQLRDTLLAGLQGAGAYRRIEAALQRYLSRSHRDTPEQGCPVPAMLSEIARDGGPARAALAAELDDHVRALAGVGVDRAHVLGTLSLMYGGLALARAARGTPLSDEILKASRDYGRAALRGAGIEPEAEPRRKS